MASTQSGLELVYGVAAILFFVGLGQVERHRERGQLAACRALVDAEQWERAVAGLKELTARRGTADEAAYLVALAYDRQGARKLALGSYELYLQKHPTGLWAVEARVRKEELEGPQLLAREVAVLVNCPFCKSALTDATPTVDCAACGTAHHAGCYEEQGGCAVYGCESKAARARESA